MPIRFLLDEHLRGPLWLATQHHNASGGLSLDVVRVGDPGDLPLQSDDPTILLWAEREDRILITEDKHTMPGHLVKHLQSGHHSPGVFNISSGFSIGQLVAFLELAAHAGDPSDYADTITYIP